MNVFEKRKPARTAAPSPWASHPPAFRAGRSIWSTKNLQPEILLRLKSCNPALPSLSGRQPVRRMLPWLARFYLAKSLPSCKPFADVSLCLVYVFALSVAIRHLAAGILAIHLFTKQKLCFSVVLAYLCPCSVYKECTQVFAYSVVKVQESAFHWSIGHFLKSFKMFFADRRKSPLTYKDKKGVKINLFLEKTKRKIVFVGTTKYCILKLCRITAK